MIVPYPGGPKGIREHRVLNEARGEPHPRVPSHANGEENVKKGFDWLLKGPIRNGSIFLGDQLKLTKCSSSDFQD